MVKEGRLTEEEAGVHPQRSILTRALGVEETVKVDERALEVKEGDRILLCTDGLTAMVRDESIAEVLRTSADPQEAAERLVDMANRAGGLDNITVVVLDFGPKSETPPSDAPSATLAESDKVTWESALPRGQSVRADTLVEPRSLADTAMHPGIGARPTRRPPGRRLGMRVLVWFVVVAAVVALAWVGLNLYVDRQWFVGIENGHVAVFRGIPTEFLGVDLNEVVEETSLPASEARRLGPWAALPDGITVDDREEAEAIVAQIRQDLQAQGPEPRTPETQAPETQTPEAPAG
jgi:protein phosphatase